MIKKTQIFLFFLFATILSTLLIFTVFPSYSDSQQEKNTFQWTYSKDSLKTLDGHMISLFATANVAIIDSDTFSNSVYSKESARNRLDEIIVPAIETGIMAHKKNQLTMSDKTSESGVEINKEILNWIIGLYGKYPQRFGMQVTDFNVFLK